MSATSFGYQPGDGTGGPALVYNGNFIGDGAYFTAFTNTTGATVYVSSIDLLNVWSVNSGVQTRVAIYSDDGMGYPVRLLAATAYQLAAVGTNSLPLVGDPLAIAPGVTIHAGLTFTGPANCTDVTATRRSRARPGGAVGTTNPFPDPMTLFSLSAVDKIMPLLLRGDTVGPGDPTNVLTPLVLSDSLDDGYPTVASDFAAAITLGEGYPNVAVDLMTAASLAEGYPTVQVGLFLVQALFPVVEGGEMATDELLLTAGVDWSAGKRPTFNTSLEEASNLRDVTAALAQFPRWEFEISFPFLSDDETDPTLLTTQLKYCEGFFCKMRGRHRAWLWRDPDDNAVSGAPMLKVGDGEAVADGVTTDFWFARDIGGQFYEPVGQVDTAAGYRIDVAGVAVAAADYTFLAPNRISFATAPADGAQVTWVGGYFFVCKFMDDAADLRRFAGKLWEWQQVAFRSVLS